MFFFSLFFFIKTLFYYNYELHMIKFNPLRGNSILPMTKEHVRDHVPMCFSTIFCVTRSSKVIDSNASLFG